MKGSANNKLFRVWRVFAVALVLFVIAVVVMSTRSHAAGWAGKVATVNGVKTVQNPATGFAPPAIVAAQADPGNQKSAPEIRRAAYCFELKSKRGRVYQKTLVSTHEFGARRQSEAATAL